MRGLAVSVATILAAVVSVSCGGSSSNGGGTPAAQTTTVTVTQPPTPTAAPVLTPAPSAGVVYTQSVSVTKALFPQVSGKYLECDQGVDSIASCPFSARLKAQIAVYSANYHRICPQGCPGGLLLLRQQCGGFNAETVSTPQNQSIGIAMLTGNSCLGGSGTETMYVQVVIDNGQPVADDIWCNDGDPKYGMYNADPNATGGLKCAPFS